MDAESESARAREIDKSSGRSPLRDGKQKLKIRKEALVKPH